VGDHPATPRLTKENVVAFLSRPWEELELLERRHWAEALAKDPLATFRRADLEAHVRYRALLDRAGHATKQAR
jgi:hypothetical protein